MSNAEILADLRSRMAELELRTSVERSDVRSHEDLSQHEPEVGKQARREARQKEAAPDAFKKIIALVNVSERSERAVRQRLAKEGFTNEEIDEAGSRALDYGFIDDMRFAAILIRSRLSQGKGTAGIQRELREHGIEIDDVPGWPEEFVEEDDEYNRALQYLDKHPTRSKNKRDGAYRKLVQRGFSSSVAASAAREWAQSE